MRTLIAMVLSRTITHIRIALPQRHTSEEKRRRAGAVPCCGSVVGRAVVVGCAGRPAVVCLGCRRRSASCPLVWSGGPATDRPRPQAPLARQRSCFVPFARLPRRWLAHETQRKARSKARAAEKVKNEEHRTMPLSGRRRPSFPGLTVAQVWAEERPLYRLPTAGVPFRGGGSLAAQRDTTTKKTPRGSSFPLTVATGPCML
jgi:hypothetical protein